LKAYLEQIKTIDYVIIQHVEQDHSGSLPMVLEKYPNAKVIANSKAKELILTHLHVPEENIQVIEDGEKLDLEDSRSSSYLLHGCTGLKPCLRTYQKGNSFLLVTSWLTFSHI